MTSPLILSFRSAAFVLTLGFPWAPAISGLPAVVKGSPSVCKATLPRSLKPYVLAVETQYGKVACKLGDREKTFIDERGIPEIIVMSDQELGDPAIVSHELMHLWLGTKGWNMSGRYLVPHVMVMPEGDEQAVEECFAALENLIEHRVFTPILHHAGISDRQEELQMLKREEQREGQNKPYPPVLLGAIYLEMTTGDQYVGNLYAQFLRKTGRARALGAADVLSNVLDQKKPRTQTEALWAVQECFDKVFSPGSPYLDLVP